MKKTLSENQMRMLIIDKIKETNLAFYYENEYQPTLDTVIQEIYDLTKDNVFPLTKKETYILRKNLGVFDEGYIQNLNTVGRIINLSRERVRQISEDIYDRIAFRLVNKIETVENADKMSSIDLKDSYKNISIADIVVNNRIVKTLINNKIYSLHDALCYSVTDYLNMGLGKTTIIKITEFANSLGYKTIDQLSKAEKQTIIEKSSKDTINNSTIYWIDNIDKKERKLITKNSYADISVLADFIENNDLYNRKNLLLILNDIGLTVNNNGKIIKKSFEEKEEDDKLLSDYYYEQSLSYRTYNILRRAGFKTIKEVANNYIEELKTTKNIGEKLLNEIIDLVHNSGYHFLGEIDDDKQTKINLLKRYKQLMRRKSLEEIKTMKLDIEINELINELEDLGIDTKDFQRVR